MSFGSKAAAALLAALASSCLLASEGKIVFTPEDATNAFAATAEFVAKHTPRDAGTFRGRLAAGWILDRVSRCGADGKLDVFTAPSPKGEKQFANVVVEFPGAEPAAQWIVVMSHFDTPPGIGGTFQGANDGGSTTGLLIALAEVLRRGRPHRDNIALVWTDAEECMVKYGEGDGFQGSAHLAESFRKQGRKVKAAVCLDMLGDKDLNIMIPANTTPALLRIAFEAARNAGLEGLLTYDGNTLVHDDHAQFLKRGFPAILFIDFHFGSAPGLNDFWHTPQDTMDKLSQASMLKAGKLAAEFINLLQRSRNPRWTASSLM